MSRSASVGYSSGKPRHDRGRLSAWATLLALPAVTGCVPTLGVQDTDTPPTTLSVPPDYALAWSDEFSGGSAPSEGKWVHDRHRNRQGWYNGELQYYGQRPRNVRVEDGKLIIEAHAERLNRHSFRDWGGQAFTSGRLITRGRASWRYGYFEIRARLSCASGTWPAAWLLPDYESGRWEGGEIDIFEHVGAEPGKVHHSLQTATHNFRAGNHPTAISAVPGSCDAFHTYQLLWTASAIVMGVDGKVGLVVRRGELDSWFDRPMYLIVNMAVGGHWGGKANPADLPARMQVDFVRVYQKRGR